MAEEIETCAAESSWGISIFSMPSAVFIFFFTLITSSVPSWSRWKPIFPSPDYGQGAHAAAAAAAAAASAAR